MMILHERKAGVLHPSIIAPSPHLSPDLSSSPAVWTLSQLPTEEKRTHFQVCSILEHFYMRSCFPAVLWGRQNGFSESTFIDESKRLGLRLLTGVCSIGHTFKWCNWGSNSHSLSPHAMWSEIYGDILRMQMIMDSFCLLFIEVKFTGLTINHFKGKKSAAFLVHSPCCATTTLSFKTFHHPLPGFLCKIKGVILERYPAQGLPW